MPQPSIIKSNPKMQLYLFKSQNIAIQIDMQISIPNEN